MRDREIVVGVTGASGGLLARRFVEVALETLGVAAGDCVMVGDRIETDIVMGKRLGLATVLVLTGITRRDDPRIAELRPDLVLDSIGSLLA